ncbi:MFS transporter [Oceanicoccus sp. KOV_DT_Chl]|uniref:MFS transporter n=1 Tax=Oceanicoccus sp. KOV_DT_Chl TaxID=1904639 RepID=UPI000C7A6E1C|nr:MFS transporter [Oceanicoccus sp. KOV_DT_Chl]
MQADQRKYGPVLLSAGVTGVNATTYFWAALVGICLVLCVNLLQPYLLQENLAIPRDQQGKITGSLALFQEIIVILAVVPLGWIADRIGRRPVFVSGFVLFSLGFILYPLAGSSADLYGFRFIIALGAAAYSIGLFSISADYPDNKDRGKWTMIFTLVQGVTAAFFAGPYLAKLPQLFIARDIDVITAGQYAFWVIAALGGFSAVVMAFGLAGPGIEKHQERSNWKDMLTTGIAEAKRNPRIAVSYVGAFATRGDFAIIAAFLMLWVTQAGTAQGMETKDALARAGMLFGLSQLAATVTALFIGPLLDKIDRLTGFVIAMGIATVCYLHMYFITDPLGSHMLLAVLLLGVAEMCTIVAGQVLMTQEAPSMLRGRVIGLFSLFGAFGIMVGTSVGGVLYDHWMKAGPYVFMG